MLTSAYKSLNLSDLHRRDPARARQFYGFWNKSPASVQQEDYKILPRSASQTDSNRLHVEHSGVVNAKVEQPEALSPPAPTRVDAYEAIEIEINQVIGTTAVEPAPPLPAPLVKKNPTQAWTHVPLSPAVLPPPYQLPALPKRQFSTVPPSPAQRSPQHAIPGVSVLSSQNQPPSLTKMPESVFVIKIDPPPAQTAVGTALYDLPVTDNKTHEPVHPFLDEKYSPLSETIQNLQRKLGNPLLLAALHKKMGRTYKSLDEMDEDENETLDDDYVLALRLMINKIEAEQHKAYDKEFNDLATDKFIGLVANQLETICQKNAERKVDQPTIFHMKNKPNKNIENYLKRINKYEVTDRVKNIRQPIIISALIYMSRYLKSSGSFINDYNVHQLLAVSLRMAMDCNLEFDQTNTKQFFAGVVGIASKVYISLENNFYKTIDFDTVIATSIYEKWEMGLATGELEKLFAEERIRTPKIAPTLSKTPGCIKYDEFWLDTLKRDEKTQPTRDGFFVKTIIPQESDDQYDLETPPASPLKPNNSIRITFVSPPTYTP